MARRLGAALALWLAAPVAAGAEEPLSAIDWLSETLRGTQAQPLPEPLPDDGLIPETITVSRIDPASVDGIGLIPASRAGLPVAFWGTTPALELARQVRSMRGGTLPALDELALRLLITEFAPPTAGEEARGALFLARVDKLLDFGALDQAQAMLEAVGADSPEVFRRWFDVSLLTGQEDAACAGMRQLPDMAPTYPARIYCLARGGDWNAAALTLRSAMALGLVTEAEEALLIRFLDPEDPEPLPAPVANPSPLVWRILEAIGEPVPTQSLPLAYAHADLRGTAGWRAQLEAAERLTRAGVLTPNRLLGLYSERMPAASGGIWERVTAVQRFEAALNSRDPAAVAAALMRVWPRITAGDLDVPFAALYAERLAPLPLTGEAAALRFRIGLLSPQYETVAHDHSPADAQEAFLSAIARGQIEGEPAETGAQGIEGAIADAFANPPPVPDAMRRALDDGALGAVVLAALDRLADGAGGDARATTEGLATLRHLGLEDVARRAALQLMLLERQG